jgi:hypothetical protein
MSSPVRRLGARLERLLYSSRPRWALMPGYVATNFVECLLFTLSALDRAGIRSFGHWGTLLGAHRLGGVCPWDEDADVFLLDETRESVEGKVGSVLRENGLDLIWTGRHFWVRQRPWWAGQGLVSLELFPACAAGPWPDGPAWDPWVPDEYLLPLARYPFHGSWIAGPADAEAVLARLYGAAAAPAAMSGFSRPRLVGDTEAFWAKARPMDGALDWAAISRRMADRSASRWAHVSTFPWWWFNGGYNVGIKQLRRLGRVLAAPTEQS